MRNRGVRRPGVSAAVCLAMVIGALLSVLSGAAEMRALGYETQSTALRIGLGLFVGLLGALFLFNFLWALRLIKGLRRGEGVIARWTVAPATFEMFRDQEGRLRAAGQDNDYRVPRETPRSGLEILFSEDSALIGDTFFGLASAGMVRFWGVRIQAGSPPCLVFDTVTTSVSQVSHVRVHHSRGRLRVPIAHNGQQAAMRVLAHYQAVIERRTIVKPEFWRRRVRWGLVGAVVSAVTAALGFALEAGDGDFGIVPLAMAVVGGVLFAGGLILAFLATLIGRFQRHG